MSLSRVARYALNLFVSDPDLRVNSETLRTQMGIGRPKSRKLIVELESAGYIIRIRNSNIGTRLKVSQKVQLSVPSDTLYSDIAFSPISNSLKANISYIATNKFFDEVKEDGGSMNDEMYRSLFGSKSTSDFETDQNAKTNKRKRHRDSVEVAKWNSKDVAYEFADRMMDLWNIPPFRVTQSRFVMALAGMRKKFQTNGAIEVAMIDIFFSAIQHDKYKDGNHLWRSFIRIAPSIVEQARISVTTPEQRETAIVEAKAQAAKKLALFDDED